MQILRIPSAFALLLVISLMIYSAGVFDCSWLERLAVMAVCAILAQPAGHQLLCAYHDEQVRSVRSRSVR